jgi:hypothetical protein
MELPARLEASLAWISSRAGDDGKLAGLQVLMFHDIMGHETIVTDCLKEMNRSPRFVFRSCDHFCGKNSVTIYAGSV